MGTLCNLFDFNFWLYPRKREIIQMFHQINLSEPNRTKNLFSCHFSLVNVTNLTSSTLFAIIKFLRVFFSSLPTTGYILCMFLPIQLILFIVRFSWTSWPPIYGLKIWTKSRKLYFSWFFFCLLNNWLMQFTWIAINCHFKSRPTTQRMNNSHDFDFPEFRIFFFLTNSSISNPFRW